MISNSNYSIGLQLLKPIHTAYCGLHNLSENCSSARDINGRDETETSAFRDRDVDSFSWDETETRHWYVSRPRPQPWLQGSECYLVRLHL